ncbi:MAG: galactitol-1-phosphate 5-dehydrogenase [Acidobacteriota bacterium]|nr:galactitol-1-phosphate 5-dehydrogenase [Acidobacteriota bacterium]
MNALLLTGYLKLEMVEMPEPEVGPDDVLVRVRACGICGSDVHGYDGSSGRRHPPLIMGHEAAGEVARTGANVHDLKPGDRVTFDSTVYCGQCFFCVRGDVNLCDNRQVVGVAPKEFRRHGAFAEYVSVPRRIVYRLPDEFPYEQAALIEAVSIGVHAVSITPIKLGDTVVIVGAGMIGSVTLQAARAAGCVRIVAVDIDDSKLERAKNTGATDVLNPKKTDVQAAVLEMTGGRGADVAFECVGHSEPVGTAICSVRKGGMVTLVGNIAPNIEAPLQYLVTRQIRLQGSCASNGEYPQCIDLMSKGIIKVAPLISAVAPLSEGASWFNRLYHHEPNLMKVVLQP